MQAEKTMFYATQARDRAPHYQHSEIGFNYRMSNIFAGIGRGQMMVLEEYVSRRRAIHELYKKELSDTRGISVFDDPSPDFQSNHWLTCIVVDPEKSGFTREDLRLRLEAENIESRPLWKPMHLQPVFEGTPFYGNGTAEKLFESGLCLPSGPNLTDEDVQRVVRNIRG
jgi:dTDP-4-amino-4,6-dideoxygalactose transaminase